MGKVEKKLFVSLVMLGVFLSSFELLADTSLFTIVRAEVTETENVSATSNVKPSISYSAHVQSNGWMKTVKDGAIGGTQGQKKRMEAIKVSVENINKLGVEYSTHVQKKGWMNWVSDGELSGTQGESKRLEAIKIRLTGEEAKKYDIYYRVHAEKHGWLGWAKNGAEAGTEGLSKRLEAIEIIIIKKGEAAPGSTKKPFVTKTPIVTYSTHVQSRGWQGWAKDGKSSGTTGQAKRLEGIKVKVDNLPYAGNIQYKTHVQSYGWQNWVSNGKLSGTEGKSKRLEAIQIQLTGDLVKHYDVYYRVHAESYGWLDWAKNGESAGTEGLSKRLESIEIKLVPKGNKAPGSTKQPFVKKDVVDKKEVIEREKEVAFETQVIEDNTIPLGETKVVQKGVAGYDAVTYEVIYTNGKENRRVEINRNKVSPISQIIKKGTRIVVESVTITTIKKSMLVGENLQLNAEVKPGSATDTTLIWSSSNEAIATIDTTGIITASGVGTTTITVATKDGKKFDSMKLTVLPIEVDSVTLDKAVVDMTEGEEISLHATVLPENATDQTLVWKSSDESTALVNDNGTITAVKAGVVLITATTSNGDITAQTNVTVSEPKIVSIENISATVVQNDEYTLPNTVVAFMNNNTTKEVAIEWNSSDANTSVIGTQVFTGTVDGYEKKINLMLEIKKYDPKFHVNAYSAVTINGLSRQVAIQADNLGEKTITINKIEVYEQGVLYNTLTTTDLTKSGIATDIMPNQDWAISFSNKLGIWVNGSYVKFYIEVNGTNYEIIDDL